MGDFEVTLTFSVKAEDRFDAANQVYALIDAQTPTAFWVCNEGGVGDEVRVDGRPRPAHEGVATQSVHELVDDLYRLGVSFGAGKSHDSEHDHLAKVDEIKRRLISAAADARHTPCINSST
jgi:hypothetical protein